MDCEIIIHGCLGSLLAIYGRLEIPVLEQGKWHWNPFVPALVPGHQFSQRRRASHVYHMR